MVAEDADTGRYWSRLPILPGMNNGETIPDRTTSMPRFACNPLGSLAKSFAVALLACIATANARAQDVRSVSTRAVPDSSFSGPSYPEMLRSAFVAGSVTTRFVVDAAGRVDMGSLRVVSSDNSLFTSAVRQALQNWPFQPALRLGRPALDTLQMTFDFEMPRDKALQPFEASLISLSTPTSGAWKAVIGGPLHEPQFSSDPAALRAAGLSALDTLLASIAPTDLMMSTRIACVALSKDEATAEPDMMILAQLARSRVAVVVHARCPRNFGSPICVLRIGEDKCRPDPAGEDPRRITLGRVRVWGDRALVEVEMSFSTVADFYSCFAVRDPSYKFGWRARCEVTATRVSTIR